MLRLSPSDFHRFSQTNSLDMSYGGSEYNVSVLLSSLDIPISFVTRCPNNDFGKLVLSQIKSHNIESDFVVHGGDRQGLYFLEQGAMHRRSKIIYDRKNSSFSEFEPQMVNWEKVFEKSHWFHWSGITPGISKKASETCLFAVQTAKRMGLTISVDLNYRSKLWNYGTTPSEIMPKLVSYCDVVIGGIYVAKNYFNMDMKPNPKLETYQFFLEKIKEKFPNIKILATNVRKVMSASQNTISGCLYDGEKFYESSLYNISHIVDRVGTGDAFVGGLIYGLIHFPKNLKKVTEFATANSCFKHTIKGDSTVVSLEEIENLMNANFSADLER